MALSTISGTTGITDATITSAKLADFSAAVDLNGVELLLDADQDTSISADTDDQIDIKIGGADDFQFTANTFTALSGSTIKANTIAETTSTSGVTIDGVLLKDGVLGANTVDSDAYVDGSIDLAHMSSESVDEDNLYISNAGSNGQFLSKQSGNNGGLTWATASANTPSSADGQALGSASLEWSDLFLADGGTVTFGNDQEIILTHVADTGLTLKHTATADDKPVSITLQTGETDIAANDVIGKIDFQAPDEGTGTDAILVAAGIEAVSEGDFSSSSNATKLVFKTAASETAAEKASLSSAGVFTATSFAGSGAALTGIVSKGKNILINGAMQISQRSTSTVAQANDSNEGFATVDRWSLEFGNSAGGTITTSQNSAWGSDNGFAFNYKLDVTTADASISGNEIVFFRQTIESQHMRSCGWNYLSSSSDITLSFWVYNSKTGTYCIALGSHDGTDKMYTTDYTVSSANTWEKKTITIPGYSGLTFDNDSNAGLTLYFMLANASGRYGTADAWGASPRYGTSNQVNFLDSTSNVAYYTGIQLEVGDSATDFEHRQYGEEFALCQRYYQEHDGIKCQFSKLQMSDFDGHTQGFFCSHPTMRANPTLTRGTQYTWYGNDSSWTTTSGKWALQPYNPTHIFTEGSYDGGTGNGVIQIKCDITLDAEI